MDQTFLDEMRNLVRMETTSLLTLFRKLFGAVRSAEERGKSKPGKATLVRSATIEW